MNDTTRIVDGGLGTRSTALSRGSGYARSGDFGAALASASTPTENRPVAAGRSKHLIQAGETLYGIAKARLAQAGQTATPGASMRHALEIAKANQIHNPDRIHAGQSLELPSPAGTSVGAKHARVEHGRSTAYSHGLAIYALHEPSSPPATPAADLPDGLADGICVGENDMDPAHEPATAAEVAEADVSARSEARNRADSVENAPTALSLYRQVAPSESAKPPTEVPDLVYKGVVGKVLDILPLEPSTRTGLQQANAIIGSSFAGRSLAALTGLGGPLLTIAGLVWGIFSAHKISAAQPAASTRIAQNTNAANVD